MRHIKFTPTAFKEYNQWVVIDKSVYRHLSELIVETARDPFGGRGKPEPLRGNFSGWWSRRINHEHRLVYRVETDMIVIHSCYGHYDD
jgi:toxin YoeB